MIPYFELPTLHLPLGLQINAFGIIMAGAMLLGVALFQRALRVHGPGQAAPLEGLPSWAVIGGMAGAHLLHVLGYHPELLREQGPLTVLKFWEGLSSMGGVLGGLAGILIFFRRHHIAIRPYLDPMALATAPAWALARVGCFLVHDHPGVRSTFFLAVQFPGGARHDLGLYDVFVLATVSAVLYLLARRRPPAGTLMGVLAMTYSVPRFFLDFLRASDLPESDGRYFGLTPAQYIVPVLFVVGVVLVVRARGQPSIVEAAASSDSQSEQPGQASDRQVNDEDGSREPALPEQPDQKASEK